MPRFVVIESDVLVAQDLSEILASHVPGAQVERAADIAEASGRLGSSVDLVFVDGDGDAGEIGDLARAARMRGGRVVVTGGAAVEAPDLLAIPAPFTSRNLAEFLDELAAKGG